jgi:hypothetical protein
MYNADRYVTCGVGGIQLISKILYYLIFIGLSLLHSYLPISGFATRTVSLEADCSAYPLSFCSSSFQQYKLPRVPTSAYTPCKHRMPLDTCSGRNCFDLDTAYWLDSQGHMGHSTLMLLLFGMQSFLPVWWDPEICTYRLPAGTASPLLAVA